MEARLSKLSIPPSLEEASWEQIKEISGAGLASSVFRVGDMKQIVLNGMVGTVEFVDYVTYVYIIGIDHNKENEGTSITFGCFKNEDGIDIALADDFYDQTSEDGTKFFNMNHSSNTNTGGWKGCDLRYDILGSTDSKNENATATTATNPVANTLMAALPADLRAVMKPITVYTNNTGGKDSDDILDVTDTIDYLPLLAEYEIFGEHLFANHDEQKFQRQYAYYSTGNSTVKYRYDDVNSTIAWWERSPDISDDISFCAVGIYESPDNMNSVESTASQGIAPIFRV